MGERYSDDTCSILRRLARGDHSAESELYQRVYEELRELAVRMFRNRPAGQTLQPTALVHEAFLKLVDHRDIGFEDRAHFLAVAAKVMRNILIDQARRRRVAKRGGQWIRVSLHDNITSTSEDGIDMLALDEALGKLTASNSRPGRVMELRYFGGMTIAETAKVLDIGHATVESDTAFAKAWLARELADPNVEQRRPSTSEG